MIKNNKIIFFGSVRSPHPLIFFKSLDQVGSESTSSVLEWPTLIKAFSSYVNAKKTYKKFGGGWLPPTSQSSQIYFLTKQCKQLQETKKQLRFVGWSVLVQRKLIVKTILSLPVVSKLANGENVVLALCHVTLSTYHSLSLELYSCHILSQEIDIGWLSKTLHFYLKQNIVFRSQFYIIIIIQLIPMTPKHR